MGVPWIFVILAWMVMIPVAYPISLLMQLVELIGESIASLFGFVG